MRGHRVGGTATASTSVLKDVASAQATGPSTMTANSRDARIPKSLPEGRSSDIAALMFWTF
ncbi:hypothetical protein BHK69_14575 [Bosea vaviloviae]|uniref:Uncharacterized protein n=1 Tax=Bosea vaviloviae TaxID=1526658 RepID=A0A1D7U2B7_9HYPH|nr:hypothetical protein BHK69_14575 [Bosea vaviloviae]